MAQQASLQIVHPTEGVMEEPSFINRHRIDREISSPEITLKRPITVPRQRILVVGLRLLSDLYARSKIHDEQLTYDKPPTSKNSNGFSL
jgi:hypothetical protein